MLRKKGSIELGGSFVDFWAYIVYVLIILVFIILFALKGCSEEAAADEILEGAKSSLDPNIVLMNYLRTPVTIRGEEMNMADLIVIRVKNSNYDQQLREESEKILTPIHKSPFFWGITVFDEKDSELLEFYQGAYAWTFEYDEVSKSRQKIPYQKGTGYYVVELTKWED